MMGIAQKNIYLVGFMGTGKTSVGMVLAQRLKREFVEMDAVIEEREKMRIVDIFREKGEKYFRKVEKDVLKDIAQRRSLIVSCGGGVVIDEENIKILKDTGIVFCLNADAYVIYQRVKNEKHRPLLNVDNPLQKIKELLKQRERFYQQAHYQIDANCSVDDVVKKIESVINGLN